MSDQSVLVVVIPIKTLAAFSLQLCLSVSVSVSVSRVCVLWFHAAHASSLTLGFLGAS